MKHFDQDDSSYDLIRMRSATAALHFWLKAVWLQRLVDKANFNPNQSKVPRGNSDGGRWTREGGRWIREAGQAPELSPPEEDSNVDPETGLPEKRPASVRVRNVLARALATLLAAEDTTSPSRIAAELLLGGGHWISEHRADIWANLDWPRTLGELQRRARTPERGYEVHHVVEQESARRDGFRESLIQSDDNLVLIPRYTHEKITAWYNTRNADYGNRSPRDYLRNKDWQTRAKVGLEALIKFGALQPLIISLRISRRMNLSEGLQKLASRNQKL